MKKLLLLFVSCFAILNISAQSEKGGQSVLFDAGYQTNAKRFSIGAQYRYVLFNNFRFAPDVTFFFPKERTVGFDVNFNFHYVFTLESEQASLYPLMGFAMQNNRFMGKTVHGVKVLDSRGWTDFAFNLGLGFGYDFSDNMFLNTEMKYMFGDNDCFAFNLGVGFKF
ncbi:MAG: outer membrane protein [Dysgonomonas sp.]